MGSFDWVMSAGGPLICLADNAVTLWGGIFRLTIEDKVATNDYERVHDLSNNTNVLPLQKGKALVFDTGALDTSFWTDEKNNVFIMRVEYCEEWTDDNYFDNLMKNLDESVFASPTEVNDFEVSSSRLIMFDSANPGDDIIDKIVSVDIEPGRYRILTKIHDPDPTCSLVLHRFDKIT